MFCLRNWIPLLIFLANASPIYILLFLTATYILQRPCVYCSILLLVLVFSLFDFTADWFEPRWQPSATTASTLSSLTETATSLLSGNKTVTEALAKGLSETAGLVVDALNGTGGSLASSVMEGVKRKGATNSGSSAGVSGFEWLRSVMEKRQFRIPCVDVAVRL